MTTPSIPITPRSPLHGASLDDADAAAPAPEGEAPTHGMRHVVVLVGSLRKESLNRKLALALIAASPQNLTLELLEIGGLPLFNQDDEAAPPPNVVEFKARIVAADAVLFVTPEYNRSVPGVLKNAIDVASRPYGQSAWTGKPGAVASASPSALGGFGANHHLRQSMVWLDVPMMAQPEMYIGNAADLFGAHGELVKDSTRALLDKFMAAFSAWIEVHAAR